MKKCRFVISAESALKNFSLRRRINDDRDARIDFGSPRKSQESIFSHVPDGMLTVLLDRPEQRVSEKKLSFVTTCSYALSLERARALFSSI